MDTQDQAAEAVAEETVAEVTETPVVDAAAPVAEEASAEEKAEAPAVEEAPVEAVAEEAAPEHVVDGLIDGDTLVPMVHPEGGSSDAYETNGKGELLVPATDVAVMVAHGFATVAGDGE